MDLREQIRSAIGGALAAQEGSDGAADAVMEVLAKQPTVAWCATDETGTVVEALGMNQSRRFDTALYLAPGAQAAPGAPWVSLAERMPNPDKHDRVLIYTEGYDFGGEQVFDVKAEALNECRYIDPDEQPETCKAASHWMPHPRNVIFDYAARYAQPAPSVPDGVAEALQRLIENGAVLGPASSEDALLVARYRQRLLACAPSVPTESIGKMLAQAMEVAVANGANSVSMPDELVEVAAWLSGVQPNPANGQTRAVRDVIAERRRQIEVEGWAPEHDDRHGAHELAEAAACYCLSSAGKPFDYFETMWPWERWWFKVSDPRRDLVKAGALVLAEIERLDRAAAPKQEGA